jgi:O-succinylbenzoate synthase
MLKATIEKHVLLFRFEARTSRGSMSDKDTWILRLQDQELPGAVGLGECHVLEGLSLEVRGMDKDTSLLQYEKELYETLRQFNSLALKDLPADPEAWVREWIGDTHPSIQFGFESALYALKGGKLFDTPFSRGQAGLPVNGLIWMGKPDWMQEQIAQKLAQGYTTLKMKVGALELEEEMVLLRSVRKQFTPEQITLRADANGAFLHKHTPSTPQAIREVLDKLERLASLGLHSIEQPIEAGQWEEMAWLCQQSPLPIALDEELIGITHKRQREELLDQVKPAFLILKPALLGGFYHCRQWIEMAQARNIGWWITSALESNIGLRAIAEFTSTFPIYLPQGLGTGQLYEQNFPSPLYIHKGELWMNKS